MVYEIYHAVKERNVMGDQDKGIFIVYKVTLKPFYVYRVKIVCGLVQKQYVRLFQKKLC